MNRSLLTGIIILGTALCGRAQSPDITSWLQNTTVTGYGGYVSNVQLVQYSADYVYVTASCIPEYAIGPWPTDPNVPSPQNTVTEFPRFPVANTGTLVATPLGAIGEWTNGVQIFNPQDANYWDTTTNSWAMGASTGGYHRNAYIFEGVSFDSCTGHPQQTGVYHTHANPRCLYNSADSTVHSPIIGYAFDGYPIYGAYGYASTTSASGPIKRMRSSYVLTTDTTRIGGPLVSAYPLGDCCEDYVYTAGAGDLDEHNGRFCYTPDYPGGTYAYFVTIDSAQNPVYPFVLGPTYYGVLGSTNVHVTPVGPDTTYSTPTALKSVAANVIKYQVVPNPAGDFAYIYMDATAPNNVTAKLYNIMGQLVQTLYDLQPTIAYTLHMAELPAGNYYLTFEGGGATATEKIIKQ